MAVTAVTSETFETEVLKADRPVIVDFWAAWCGPCKKLSPMIHQLAEETADIKFCKVNVDEEPDLASRFRIMSIPSLLVFKDGELANTSVGLISKNEVLALV